MAPSNPSLLLLIAALLLMGSPLRAFGEDATSAPPVADADATSAPATNPPATEPPPATTPATPPPVVDPTPPAKTDAAPTDTAPVAPVENAAIEAVVVHIEAMTGIIEANLDQPDKAIVEFETYLKANAQAMRDANAAIETKLKGLGPDESQSYQEGMQRRLEDPLRKFMSAMLSFGRKHPEKAKELDEKLQKAAGSL
jgi:hypothetical protein